MAWPYAPPPPAVAVVVASPGAGGAWGRLWVMVMVVVATRFWPRFPLLLGLPLLPPLLQVLAAPVAVVATVAR